MPRVRGLKCLIARATLSNAMLGLGWAAHCTNISQQLQSVITMQFFMMDLNAHTNITPLPCPSLPLKHAQHDTLLCLLLKSVKTKFNENI